MNNLKVRYPEESEKRVITGTLRVLAERKNNPLLYSVELWLLNGETNRNDWRYENLEEHSSLFADTPLLVAYKGEKIGDGHNFKMKKDADGNEYASFLEADAERIVGWFPEKKNIRVEEKDGLRWIVGTGYLWAWYAKELVDKIAVQGGDGMDVSIETLITKMHKENTTEVYEKYIILGTTILGVDIAPAVKDAKIRALSAKELQGLKIRAASYENLQSKSESNATSNIKKGVKKNMSKSRLAQMQTLFPNHKVLAISEDGMKVCLLADNGTTAKYSFLSKEDMAAVVPERIESTQAIASFDFAGNAMNIDVTEITETLAADNITIKTALTRANEELDKAHAEIGKMKSTENTRRVAAVKKAVANKLCELNSARADNVKFDENICQSICESADKGHYTECMDEKGAWCGEEKAICDLMAKCMEEQAKFDSRCNSAKKTVFAWDIREEEKHDGATLLDAVNRINKN